MGTELKRKRGHTRLSSRNQVTLPVEIVAAMGFRQGQPFRVEIRDGDVVLVPEEDVRARRTRVLRETRGRFAGMYEPGYLEGLRDEWA